MLQAKNMVNENFDSGNAAQYAPQGAKVDHDEALFHQLIAENPNDSGNEWRKSLEQKMKNGV